MNRGLNVLETDSEPGFYLFTILPFSFPKCSVSHFNPLQSYNKIIKCARFLAKKIV